MIEVKNIFSVENVMGMLDKYRRAIFCVSVVLFLLITYLVLHFMHFLYAEDSVQEIHYLIFVATSAIAIIAWYEFNKSNKLTASEFLLFTSDRWGSEEIIKARKILHGIFVKAYRIKSGQDFNIAMNRVSEKILEMSRKGGHDGEDFVDLLNLLDYLETISYFYCKGYLILQDVQNTCGNNAIFFYESFELYILQRRSHDKESFGNFTLLYEELKKIKANNVS